MVPYLSESRLTLPRGYPCSVTILTFWVTILTFWVTILTSIGNDPDPLGNDPDILANDPDTSTCSPAARESLGREGPESSRLAMCHPTPSQLS